MKLILHQQMKKILTQKHILKFLLPMVENKFLKMMTINHSTLILPLLDVIVIFTKILKIDVIFAMKTSLI